MENHTNVVTGNHLETIKTNKIILFQVHLMKQLLIIDLLLYQDH